MKKIFIFLGLSLFALLDSLSAKNGFVFSANGGLGRADFNVGGAIGYNKEASEKISIRPSISYSYASFSPDNKKLGIHYVDYNVDTIDTELRWLQPYLGVGVGYANMNLSGYSPYHAIGVSARAGLIAPIVESVELNLSFVFRTHSAIWGKPDKTLVLEGWGAQFSKNAALLYDSELMLGLSIIF